MQKSILSILLILLILSAIATQSQAELVLAIKSSDPASLALAAETPAGTRIVDYAVWRDVPAEFRQYNPAHYPTVIDTATGVQVQRPASWAEAVAALTPEPADKPYNLKLAENALIGLLRRMEFIGPDATSIPDGTREQVEAYLITLSVTDESAEASNLIARFQGLRSTIEGYGVDVEDATWHDDL